MAATCGAQNFTRKNYEGILREQRKIFPCHGVSVGMDRFCFLLFASAFLTGIKLCVNFGLRPEPKALLLLAIGALPGVAPAPKRVKI